LKLLEFGPDVALAEIADQLVDAAELEIAAIDKPYPFGFLLNYGNFAVIS
jgi:hypothetical protein